jgi:hypothetical protein
MKYPMSIMLPNQNIPKPIMIPSQQYAHYVHPKPNNI